ncbi:hypothetical protein LTS08_005545 [Lithohypha guttulata]|nr:hypothetical protein LTS08_005545 [Lithohypha guttulata]
MPSTPRSASGPNQPGLRSTSGSSQGSAQSSTQPPTSNYNTPGRPEKDYPYKAIHNWHENNNTQARKLLDVGQLGKCLTNTQHGWISVSIGKNNAQVQVPRWAIEVGFERKFGDRRFEHDFSRISQSGVNHNNIQASNSLEKAIRSLALALSLKSNQDKMAFMSDNMRGMLRNDSQRNAYVAKMIGDLNKDYVRLACNEQSTVQDFRQALRVARLGDNRTGAYARVTGNFKTPAHRNRRPEFYVGQTSAGFYERSAGHRNPRPGDTSAGAESVRDANYCELYPICGTVGDPLYLDFIEQILIIVNGSYLPELKMQLTKATVGVSALQDFAKIYSMRESAQILSELASAVFEEIGWTPLCDRPAFGVHRGLNYDSPIRQTDWREKVLWIKTTQPGIKVVYRRSGLPVRATGATLGVIFKNGKTYQSATPNVKFGPHWKEGEGPPKGTEVFPVVELMMNGPHPYPYARLPEVGCFADWHFGNRVGIKLEWKGDDGKWYHQYFQRHNYREYMDSHEPGCTRGYAETLGLVKYLHQVPQDQPRGWMIDFGIARIKELTWDHMTQTAHLHELVAPTGAWPPPTWKTTAQITQEIQQLGALGVNGPYMVFPPGTRLMPSGRVCDTCFYERFYDGLIRKSKASGDWPCTRHRDANGQQTNICETCFHKGIVCSWTPEDQMPPRMITALQYRAHTAPNAASIDLDVTMLEIS